MNKYKIMTAAILATALAVGGLNARPAKADTDDAVRAIGALVLLGTLAAVASEKRDAPAVTLTHSDRYRYDERPRYQPRYRHAPRARGIVPADCIRRVEFRGQRMNYVAQRCIERRGEGAANLPRQCRDTLRIGDNRRHLYRVPCLRHNGFRIGDSGRGWDRRRDHDYRDGDRHSGSYRRYRRYDD
ncbi:MAG: hypothetical protein HUJ27_15755 [Rhodobacteraceae bacterium]|nr:hypothetical protein [Paracoccaceae bacterium]